MSRRYITIIFLYLLLPFCAQAQKHKIHYSKKNIDLDFTKPVYIEPLNYGDKHLGVIKRSYDKYRRVDSIIIIHPAYFRQIDSVCNFENVVFDSSGGFNSSYFFSPSSFRNAQFHSISDFHLAHFHSTIDFSVAHFYSIVMLGDVFFDSTSYFNSASFDSVSVFDFDEFHSASDFAHACFHSVCYFNLSQFHSACDFSWAQFDSISGFNSTHFHSTSNFSHAEFHSVCNFNHAKFDKESNFSYTHFRHKLVLTHLYLTGNTVFDFSYAVLPDTIDISNNPGIFLGIPATIDFTLADSLDGKLSSTKIIFLQKAANIVKNYFYPFDTIGEYRKHCINLYNTDVSKIKIDYDHFKFYAAEIDKNDTDKLSPEVTKSIYEGMLKNFKDRGQTDSYEKLDIEYKRLKAGLKPHDFSLQDWWWRYGYEKERVFKHAILFILLFSIINFFFLHLLNDKRDGVYHIDHIPLFNAYKFGFSHRRFTAFFRRFWYSLIYTSVIFFLLTLKIEKVKFSKLGSIWVMFVYTVGLICMGFIANLILQK